MQQVTCKIRDHLKQEEIVTNSSYPYHIVRPVGLKDSKSQGIIHVQTEGFLPQNYISRTDVAKYIVDSMLENKIGISAICQGNS